MAIDLTKLVSQGRAYSAVRPWTPEELDALLLLEKPVEQGGRGIGRLAAADYIRNGIVTLEAYDKATAAKFKPKTLDDAAEEAEKSLKDNEFAAAESPAKVEDEVVEAPVEHKTHPKPAKK